MEPEINKRYIRVFISSTFRDMMEERDYLVKSVFPELRILCESRKVKWGDVDLRWGITEEQNAEGKVLPICFEEITRCRPYFICLLGERYGWIPDEIPKTLINRNQWLEKHIESSVTELEILHGVLLNPTIAEHAFFYFRDPKYIEKLPKKKRAIYIEEDPLNTRRLNELKNRIRKSGFPVRENYQDPEALGELVRKDLSSIVEQLFPIDSTPPRHELITLEHSAYANSVSGNFVLKSEYVEYLEKFVNSESSDSKGLVVFGPPGCGKSSLLAYWSNNHSNFHEKIIVTHYVGVNTNSFHWESVLRRLIEQICRMANISEVQSLNRYELREYFFELLEKASAHRRLVIVIDALDKLEDRDRGQELHWLPRKLPTNVRIIVSSRSGFILDRLIEQDWNNLEIGFLNVDQVERLVTSYLEVFGKSPNSALTERLRYSELARNPRNLLIILEEIRIFGSHQDLLKFLDGYLDMDTTTALYCRVFERWEKDYERSRPGLVGDVLGLIWASRDGISETEIRDILGDKNGPLPHSIWSSLYFAAKYSIYGQGNGLQLANDEIYQAIERMYCSNWTQQKNIRLRIANYFDQQRDGRRTTELPWQLSHAKEWKRLADVLSDPHVVGALQLINPGEVENYWRAIETHTSLRAASCYLNYIEKPYESGDKCWAILNLLTDLGSTSGALKLCRYLSEQAREENNLFDLHAILGLEGRILVQDGNPKEALERFAQQENVSEKIRQMSDPFMAFGTSSTFFAVKEHNEGIPNYSPGDLIRRLVDFKEPLLKQAYILQDLGEFKQALEKFEKAEQRCLEWKQETGLHSSLIGQAKALAALHQTDAALKLLQRVQEMTIDQSSPFERLRTLSLRVRILRKAKRNSDAFNSCHEWQQYATLVKDSKSKAEASIELGLILINEKKFEEADHAFEKAEDLYRKIKEDKLAIKATQLRAKTLKVRQKPEEALGILEMANQIARSNQDMNMLVELLGSQANLLFDLEKFDNCLEKLQEQEKLLRGLQRDNELKEILAKQSVVFQQKGINLLNKGQLDEAWKFFDLQESICNEINRPRGLQAALNNKGLILKKRGQHHKALKFFRQQAEVCLNEDARCDLPIALINQASLLSNSLNDHAAAVPLAIEALHISQTENKKHITTVQGVIESIWANLKIEADRLKTEGAYDDALKTFKLQEMFAEKLENPFWQQGAIAEQALILKLSGDFKGALQLSNLQQQICEEANDLTSLANCFNDRALILMKTGQLSDAHSYLNRQEDLSRQIEYNDGLVSSLINQAALLIEKRDPLGAAKKVREAFTILDLSDVKYVTIARDSADSIRSTLLKNALDAKESGNVDQSLVCFREAVLLSECMADYKVIIACNEIILSMLVSKFQENISSGHHKQAINVCREMEDIHHYRGELKTVALLMGARANLLEEIGDLAEALRLLENLEDICNSANLKEELTECKNRQAEIRREI